MCYHKLSKRVLILLALDDKRNSNLNHRQIASALNTTVTTIVATARDCFQNGLEHIPPDDIETAFEGETGALEGCSSLNAPAPPEKRSLSFLTKTFFLWNSPYGEWNNNLRLLWNCFAVKCTARVKGEYMSKLRKVHAGWSRTSNRPYYSDFKRRKNGCF